MSFGVKGWPQKINNVTRVFGTLAYLLAGFSMLGQIPEIKKDERRILTCSVKDFRSRSFGCCFWAGNLVEGYGAAQLLSHVNQEAEGETERR